MKTLNEIDTTAKRASKATGFSWGIAEEVGKSIESLELFGLPGITNLNLYLKKIKKNHPKKLNKIEKENRLKNKELCPIYCGVAFLDKCWQLETLQSIKYYNVSHPLLILPFISKTSQLLGKKILIEYNKSSFLLNFNKSIFSKNADKQIDSLAKEMRIEFLENKNYFSEKNWKELYKLSEKTFVEESESSKTNAAGAGLIDND